MNRTQIVVLVFLLVAIGFAIWLYAKNNDPWQVASVGLAAGIVITVLSVGQAFLNQVRLDEAPRWVEEVTNLGSQADRMRDHFSRMKGTLVFWKNEAKAHYRLDVARVVWSLLSAVLLPVLVQLYDTAIWANVFMTTFTTWTGLVVALAYTMKSEQRYQGMRQQESDYYDLTRHLLDFAKPDDPNLEAKVDQYIADVEKIRQAARRVETGAPASVLELLRLR